MLLVCCMGLTGAGAPDPQELLQRAVPRALSNLERIPNCTCVQTVDRDYVRAAKVRSRSVCEETLQDPFPMRDRIASADRLRLEVTMSGRGEIFSWAGASHFEDSNIDQVVTTGAIGTGTFAGFLGAAFKDHGRGLTFRRNLIVNQRGRIEYAFFVNELESGYHVKTFSMAGDGIRAAYTGTVQIDTETADVVAISVRTAKLPREVGNCRTLTSIEFANTKLGNDGFLLPTLARQRFVYANGEEIDNTITFSLCREYHTETTLMFGDAEPPPGENTAKPEPCYLLAGLRFTLELTAPIVFKTAAAGDPFTAKLTEPIQDENGRTFAPKGAVVKGRLMRVEFRYSTHDVVLLLRPDILELSRSTVMLKATRVWSPSPKQPKQELIVGRPGEQDSVAFIFAHASAVPKGFRSDWQTVAHP